MQPKILLVDDREDNLLAIETILGADNYRFVKASSGRNALKILLSEFDFALILMDVKMPSLDGFETATLIYEREKLRHIPIIFITAHSYGDENIFRGYQTGAVDYIYKPINPEFLKAKVTVFVELYKKNHRLMLQEQRLTAINRSLENEINERKTSEEKIKALNRQLLESIDRLEAANRDLDRFAFMASHDLQEPLRKIRMFSDRLSSRYADVVDEEGKNYIARIQNGAERMQALIKDILIFSKLSIEKGSYHNSDLNVLLDEVLTDLEGNIQEKEATIITDKLPSLFVNPNLMRPLFHNLISNALKYSKKATRPVIKVYARMEDSKEPDASGSQYCRIFFEDNGIGFDQKYAEQIFGMFKRLHSNTEFEGTGIGLALCKKIVEEHLGFIAAQSRVDEGAVFIVSLPVNLAQRQEEKLLFNNVSR